MDKVQNKEKKKKKENRPYISERHSIKNEQKKKKKSEYIISVT